MNFKKILASAALAAALIVPSCPVLAADPITISTIDADTRNPIGGAVYEVTLEDGSTKDYTAGKDGTVEVDADGAVSIAQATPPTNYQKNTEVVELDGDDHVTFWNTVKLYHPYIISSTQTGIRSIKVKEDGNVLVNPEFTGKLPEGAVIVLYAAEDIYSGGVLRAKEGDKIAESTYVEKVPNYLFETWTYLTGKETNHGYAGKYKYVVEGLSDEYAECTRVAVLRDWTSEDHIPPNDWGICASLKSGTLTLTADLPDKIMAPAVFEILSGDVSLGKIETDDGTLEIILPLGEYEVRVEADGCVTATETIVVTEDPTEQTIELELADSSSGDDNNGSGTTTSTTTTTTTVTTTTKTTSKPVDDITVIPLNSTSTSPKTGVAGTSAWIVSLILAAAGAATFVLRKRFL